MPKIELNAKFVATATAGGKDRELYWDAALPGFGLMVTANGARSYVIQYRNADGISRRMTINGNRKFTAAKLEAKKLLGKIAGGDDPLRDKRQQRDAKADTLRKIVENEYFADPDVQKLRSLHEKRGTFERYVFPYLGTRPVTEIRRSEIVKTLRHVRQKNGPGAAGNAFRTLSSFFSWYIPMADDDFVSPIVRGTWVQGKQDGARTLADDEVKILWRVASEGLNPYDSFIRLTLLTAARRDETAEMVRSELSADGLEWTIPASRYKSKHAHLVPLSPLARQVLAAVPVVNNSKFVFTTNGRSPIAGHSKFKAAFDARLRAALDQEGDEVRRRIIADLHDRYPGRGFQPFDSKWQTHSLRKTARTLLSRVKIDQQTAERCLGHVVGGIVGTYNHHESKVEKRIAFEALAREIERIASGDSPNNVIPLARF
jgi:Phage integrase family/Arm DNA-binding domain